MTPELAYELQRFKTMTVSQLRTRLGRITTNTKLVSFQWVANKIADKTGIMEYRLLADEALEKRNNL